MSLPGGWTGLRSSGGGYRLAKEPQRAGRMAKLPLVLVKAAGKRVKKA